MTLIAEEPIPVDPTGMSPDCRAGKHGGCVGEGFDDATGEIVPCTCGCNCRICGEHGAAVLVVNATVPTLLPIKGLWVRGYALHQGRCETRHEAEVAR